MELGLDGRTAIVTGGSFGLGRATALALAREGVRVAMCGRNRDTLDAAARGIESATSATILPVVADVRDPASIEQFVAAVLERFGAVDVLVNCADSGGHEGGFFDVSDEDWQARIEVKLLAAVRFARLVAPSMMARRWGRIVNVTSATTRRRTSNNGGWTKGATQAGIINLTKKLSQSLGSYGITVNCVEPGRMNDATADAELSDESLDDVLVERERIAQAARTAGVSSAEMEQRMVNDLVIGRRIEAADVADIIVFLASARAAIVTGEVLLADGGENPCVRY